MLGLDSQDLIPRREALGMRVPGNIIFMIILAGMAWSIYSSQIASPANLDFPQLTGRVVDNAHVMNAPTIARIEQISARLEAQTGAQLVTVTMPDLQGRSIEDFGYQLGRTWGIGRKGYDDGVLLIVAPNDREMRIEVGYGLEGVLTDAASSVIIQHDILPKFKTGDLPAGIIAGVQSIAAIVGDPANKDDLPKNGSVPSDKAMFAGAGPVNTSQPGAHSFPAVLLLPLLMFLIPLINLLNWIRALLNPLYGNQMVPRPRSTNRWGGGGGGGRGGGGFSGGGGRFGGGGASGRW